MPFAQRRFGRIRADSVCCGSGGFGSSRFGSRAVGFGLGSAVLGLIQRHIGNWTHLRGAAGGVGGFCHLLYVRLVYLLWCHLCRPFYWIKPWPCLVLSIVSQPCLGQILLFPGWKLSGPVFVEGIPFEMDPQRKTGARPMKFAERS